MIIARLKIFLTSISSIIKSRLNEGSLEKNLIALINMFYVLKKVDLQKILRKINFYRIYQFNLSKDLHLLNYFKYKVINLNIVDDALKQGKGLFLSSISFGLNVELFFFLAKKGYKVNFIFNEKSSLEGFQKSIDKEKLRLSPKSFDANILLLDNNKNETMLTLKKIIEALHNNEIIMFMVDNVNSNEQKNKVIDYQFLGMNMSENIGLLEIIRRYQTPLIPAIAVNKHFYKTEIIFYAKQLFLHEPDSNAIQEMFDFFSVNIIKHPEQWLNWYSIKKEYRKQLKNNIVSHSDSKIKYNHNGKKYLLDLFNGD